MFSELCGDPAMTQIILVTTMWQRVALETGEMREQELINEYWKVLIDKGSNVDRLRKATYEDAWAVVWAMLERKLKKEASGLVLLHEKQAIGELPAGVTSYTNLHEQLIKKQESMNLLLTQVENASDPYLKKELKKECQKIQRELDQTFKEAEELKQSIFTKIFSFLYTLLAGKSKRYVSESLSKYQELFIDSCLQTWIEVRPTELVKIHLIQSMHFDKVNCIPSDYSSQKRFLCVQWSSLVPVQHGGDASLLTKIANAYTKDAPCSFFFLLICVYLFSGLKSTKTHIFCE